MKKHIPEPACDMQLPEETLTDKYMYPSVRTRFNIVGYATTTFKLLFRIQNNDLKKFVAALNIPTSNRFLLTVKVSDDIPNAVYVIAVTTDICDNYPVPNSTPENYVHDPLVTVLNEIKEAVNNIYEDIINMSEVLDDTEPVTALLDTGIDE